MSTYNRYKVHPLAALFPELSPDEFKKLKSDIQAHGQQEPIMLSEDGSVLLDGRHRLRAVLELGLTPNVTRFPHNGVIRQLKEGVGLLDYRSTEADYIWSKSVFRRHLTDDKRAAIGHKWADAEREAAKERQKQHGGTAPGKPKENTLGESAKSVHTREVIAKQAHVTEHKVRQVETIAKHKPELLPKVESGEVKLVDAVKEIKTKPEPQAFDEQAVLLRLFKEWEASVMKSWPRNRALTPVVRKVYAFASFLERLEKARASNLQKRVEAVGVRVQ